MPLSHLLVNRIAATLFIILLSISTNVPAQSGKTHKSLKQVIADQVLFQSRSVTNRVKQLLRQRKFKDLNDLLHDYQLNTEKDINSEETLFTAYQAFEALTPDDAPLLEEWLAATPEDYPPYLARATFYYEQGWQQRGEKWISETNTDQLKMMNVFFNKTLEDLAVVWKQYPSSLVTYDLLIGINMVKGLHNSPRKAASDALIINPLSHQIRKRLIQSLRPRWGGSYREMEAVAFKALRYKSKNEKLGLLAGYPLADRASLASIQELHVEADKLYAQALEFGDNPYILFSKGRNNYKRKAYQQAIRELSKAISLQHEDHDYYYWRSRAYFATERYMDALADISIAKELASPSNRHIGQHIKRVADKLVSQAYAKHKEKQLAVSLDLYNAAIWVRPDHAHTYARRARVLIAQRNFRNAESDVAKAIELDRGSINHVLLMDYILAKSARWDEIIRYWDQFIEANPGNGRAYVERGGAKYRKGDIQAAVEDARISAELGNLEGEEAYTRFKHHVK